jgi:predicted nucleic acid-binding protein
VWAYFDTSALVKRYVDELGRREVQQLLRRHDCVTSAILPVELRSALRGRVAERSLDGSRVSEILKRVAADRAYWTVVEVGAEVLGGAEALVAAHPLRPLDAIHVASAQLFALRLSIADLMFVSADKHQTDVASVIGLAARLIA